MFSDIRLFKAIEIGTSQKPSQNGIFGSDAKKHRVFSIQKQKLGMPKKMHFLVPWEPLPGKGFKDRCIYLYIQEGFFPLNQIGSNRFSAN